MSEIVRWAMALTFIASLWAMAAFLIYKQAPGWGWFLLCVTLVAGSTSIHIDSKDRKGTPEAVPAAQVNSEEAPPSAPPEAQKEG